MISMCFCCRSSELGEIAVYGAHESMALLNDLVQVAASAGVRLLPHVLDRATLTRFIRTANHSFLFIDYSFWHWEPNVCKLFCLPLESESTCPKELLQDPVTPINFADVNLWESNEENFIDMELPFLVSSLSLKTILEQEGKSMSIEESACAWVVDTTSKTSLLRNTQIYEPLVFFCEDDPDTVEYSKTLNFVQYYLFSLYKQNFVLSRWVIVVKEQLINCSDPNSLIKNIYQLSHGINKVSVVGVIAAGEVGVANAASLVSNFHWPLLLVDTVPVLPFGYTNGPAAMWRVSGRPRHLALALQRFVHDSGWTRLAVLSQPTPLAAELYAEIRDGATFTHREYQIPTRPTIREAENYLHLLSTKVRVVFVNADTETAVVIMAAAIKLKMSFAEGYVWIFREWPVATAKTTVLTVSFWARGVMSAPEWLQPVLRKMRTLWPNQVWPARALAFVDALLSLAIGRFGHPLSDPEIHRAVTTMNFDEKLEQMSIQSFNHVLQYKKAAMEENFVFVDEWHGDKFTRLAAWRVNASQPSMRAAVRGPYKRPEHLPRDDGDRSRCLARAGDDFEPDCYDAVWTSTLLLLLALVAAALVMYRRVLRRRAARVLNEQESEMRARHHHVAATLTAYLVKREAVELREKLGTGNFGNVRLAYLRLPPDNSRSVAAKELHASAAPAEESEFLREACTIASFNHKHVVRLVGVCISGGPPLVLMELALFGDLLGYLRARRHLAEGAECASQESPVSVEEAAHVSGEALTRLVREAAAALTYLGSRGVVHRDVRAANCLVDARRSLKLADFGMARETTAGADGAPEYACRRRAMFPVLWMAPESLAHGVFSAASDVWALGVLVLEVVTLGARPYGSMSPLRVLEYVAAGGCPPLPLDASPHTRGLTRLCWQREAVRRPSAAEIHAYLAERPQALRAAVFEPPEADDGKFVQ
ncbi:unnamed protein product [Chrysodeixis includens]|uniref:Tyrosine-protein kinase catalytic domain-containing protein n=1 Tax=Chrysodeixis includens TaxID=689277 RepID=A0A9P0BMN9_CHRIL|nr:unnamed protein product [Chrysodeixis includens]